MKIYNADKTRILNETEIDTSKGCIIDDKILVGKTENSYNIEEITNGRKVTFKPEQNIYENIKVYIPYSKQSSILDQIEELEDWFNIYYRYWFEKCSRKIAIGATLSDGTDPNVKLKELYMIAENKAQLLHNLRLQL